MGTKTAHQTTRERTRTGGAQREKKEGRAVVRWTTQQQRCEKEEEKQKVEMKCTLT